VRTKIFYKLVKGDGDNNDQFVLQLYVAQHFSYSSYN